MYTSIKALILDIDGVIWRNKVPIGNLEEIFSRITDLGLKYAFATNNSTKTVDTYLNLLQGFGIPVTSDQINTSGSVTAKFLEEQFPERGGLFVLGMEGLKQTLLGAGFSIDADHPLAVVIGLDETFNYHSLKTAADFVRAGVPFIGTNPDVALPIQDGFNPGTGSLLAAIEAVTGIAPQIIGKPQPDIFNFALKTLGTEPEHTLVVGDRLETDISGGQAAGCQVGLVLSGVTGEEKANSWIPKPDIIAKNLSTLIEAIHDF